MIKINRGNTISLDNEGIDFNIVNKREFIIANLYNEANLEDGMTLEELVHFFYDIKEYIFEYFSEHYEVARALIVMGELNESCNAIKFYKIFSIEEEIKLGGKKEEFIFINNNIEFVPYIQGEHKFGTNKTAQLPIIVDDNIFDESETLKKGMKTKMYLMDFMTIVFDEIPAALKNESLLT